ncbi:MAG TPA: ATP-binding protein [Roseiflexaceae bacterium]|nr:ATP-binding protein [Roseiflexaceae bacterium]
MTTPSQRPSIELSIPSELGYERVARDAVAAFARRFGFDHERIEDLKTALGEACINAIEHGNAHAPGLRIAVNCVCEGECLTVEIHDNGLRPYMGHSSPAGIENKLRGCAPRRGMGLMMISALVDEAGFAASADGGNVFRLALYRRRPVVAQ